MKDEEDKIVERLDILIRLVAMNSLSGKSFKDQVEYLANAGLQPKKIADLLGKPLNNVTGTLSYIKKQKKSGTRRS